VQLPEVLGRVKHAPTLSMTLEMPKPFHNPGSRDSPIASAAKTSVPPYFGSPDDAAGAAPASVLAAGSLGAAGAHAARNWLNASIPAILADPCIKRRRVSATSSRYARYFSGTDFSGPEPFGNDLFDIASPLNFSVVPNRAGDHGWLRPIFQSTGVICPGFQT